MKKTTDYLNDAKKTLGVDSDYAMAKFLNVSGATISRYMSGDRIIDDYAAAKIAGALGIDAMIVIAAANAEREKTVERKDYWRNFYERLGGMAASIAVAGCIVIAGSDSANASTGYNIAANSDMLHIIRNCHADSIAGVPEKPDKLSC